MEDLSPTRTPVVEGATERSVLAEASKKSPRDAPKWETTARERVRAALKKFTKPLSELVDRDANEGDTRLLVTDLLCEGLGYDKYADLTTEYQVRGEFADYGIRVDKDLVAFVETKRANTKLATKHLRQVEMYAVNEGVEWMILTNGIHWQVYHLTPGMPVVIDLAIDVNLLGPQTAAEKANQLFYLTREAFKRHAIDELWKAKAASSPKSLATVLLSEAVCTAIRKELRRRTTQNVSEAEIRKILRATVIREECLGDR